MALFLWDLDKQKNMNNKKDMQRHRLQQRKFWLYINSFTVRWPTLYLAPQRGCKSLIFVGSQNWEGQSLEESALSWPWFEHVGEKPGFIVILSNLKHTAVLKTSCKNLSWKHFPTSLWSTTMRPLQKGQCLTSLVSRKVLVQPSKTNVVFYKSSALNISFWAIPAIYDLKKEQPTTGIDVLDGQ